MTVAVLDSGSLVVTPVVQALDEVVKVPWPPNGAKGVPTRFTPEMPNPLPGEDQSKWGYPITLQCWWEKEEMTRDIVMTLHLGKASGPEVPCHFSTPDEPTNPELSPDHAWCLIPKAHLKGTARYTVVARLLPDNDRYVWSFETGR